MTKFQDLPVLALIEVSSKLNLQDLHNVYLTGAASLMEAATLHHVMQRALNNTDM